MGDLVEVGTVARWMAHTRRLRGVLVLLMGCLAVAAPFFAGPLALSAVGLLLCLCGALEMLETFWIPDEDRRYSMYLSGMLSIGVGILILAEPRLVLRGLSLLVAGTFLIDGVNKLIAALKSRAASESYRWLLGGGVVNLVLAVMLVARWPVTGMRAVVILVGIRMIAAGWSMLRHRRDEPTVTTDEPVTSQHPDRRLSLPPHEEFRTLETTLAAENLARRWVDVAWCATFILVFFAIHIGRMNVAWNLVGMISPLVAVAGDIATAMLIAFGLFLPFGLGWRKLTRPLERRGWNRRLAQIDEGRETGVFAKIRRAWLIRRLRFSRRMARMRFSPLSALRWGLQVGLPATAILIAVNPIWGFSWFFNSESWATEIWDRWAAARTDTWREHMLAALDARDGNGPAESRYRLTPAGLEQNADFSFLVIGDTGEGGAAQHCLRDQFLALGQRPDVKFLVVSSDVIYPSGAMSDYEAKFYLPFKGFTKPIYAIPGNHDWYDALEGFAANFFTAAAAHTSMHARVEIDNRLTTTTDARIDEMIGEAARLRREFGVSTGWQRGPFFEVQTERFALIAVDTGVLRRVDARQWQWLTAALDRARGKFIMAILGHPLYAGGRYQGGGDEALTGETAATDGPTEVLGQRIDPKEYTFDAVHRLLRERRVDVVMAGDTHYFEHYLERYEAEGASRTMAHFVNGGGGAYLSIGTPLDWPSRPAVGDCAYFPRKDVLIEKLDRETPVWKTPLWFWVKHFRGWPLSAETMAGAFIYSKAPYGQSFVEVRVENSKGRVRLLLHGANGQVRWRELEAFGVVVPRDKAGDDPVEFVFQLTRET